MTLLYFILLVGILVFVHELGHFLVAKAVGVKVFKFSLGFGPKIVGIRRGETEYVISWIPLGGYVKMLGENPGEQIDAHDLPRAFHLKPIWQRVLVICAGPAFNLIFPVLIYSLFFSMQKKLDPAVVGHVFPGKPAAQAGLLAGDKIVSIQGSAVRYWDDLQRAISNHPGETLRLAVERDGALREFSVTPDEHRMPNRLGFVERVGLIGISPYYDLPQIGIIDPTSAAALAGLKTGDIVRAVNGKSIDQWSALERVLRENRGEQLELTVLRPSDNAGKFFDVRVLQPFMAKVQPEPIATEQGVQYVSGIESAEIYVQSVIPKSPAAEMGLRVGDRLVEFDGKELHDWDYLVLSLQSEEGRDAEHTLTWVPYGSGPRTASFRLKHLVAIDEYKQEREEYVFGASNRLLRRKADPVPIEGRTRYAVTSAVRQTVEVISITGMAFVQLIRGGLPSDTIGGPIILAHTARVAAEKGWDHFLWMMALISINLGVFNLLPIPILDGGHLLFLFFEAVRRRPISIRVREVASYIGLILLLSLMVFAFKNDIVRVWLTPH